MEIACLDLEGVLVPEIWIKFSEKTGIPELRATTRDIPNYDELMTMRLGILAKHGLGLKEIQEVIATLSPLEGAKDFIEWLRARHADAGTLWLAGFSFGAAVALQAAVGGARPQRLVTIAPPVGRIIDTPVARPAGEWLIVQGDRDELVDVAAVRKWAAGFEPPPEVIVVPGAEHFFHGKLLELRTGMREWLRSG